MLQNGPKPVEAPYGTTATISDYYEEAGTGERVRAIRALPHAGRSQARPSPRESRATPSALPTPEIRAALRAYWKAAQESAEGMVQAADTKDLMELGIAADNLDHALAKLWELRAHRDLDWRTILNHVQDTMRQFFVRKQVEELTRGQCLIIRTIVKDYLGPASKSPADLNEVLRLICDAGFDPYGAISGDPVVDGEEKRPQ